MSTKLLTTSALYCPGHWVTTGTCIQEQPALNWYKLARLVCTTLSNGCGGQTHTSQRGAACHQLLFDEANTERDKGLLDGALFQWTCQVSKIVIAQADNVSARPLL